MKKIIIFVLLFTICICTDAFALTFGWENISGVRISGPYYWRYSYDIGFFDDVLKIDLDIKPTGFTPSDELFNAWEHGIEDIWSTNRFSVPVSFNVDWVSNNYDQQVYIHNEKNVSRMSDWYTDNYDGGFSVQDEIAAHEAGHMFGLWDEYAGGAINPNTGLINTGGLMANIRGNTLDYYYADMLGWYQHKLSTLPDPSDDIPDPSDDVPDPSSVVPEPATMLLLGFGLAGAGLVKKIKGERV
jgi:hypothetical protein